MGKYYACPYGEVIGASRRVLTGEVSNAGYRRVHIGRNKVKSVHRIVAETFLPNPENKPQVNHINGNKLDNRISNLEWVTARENVLHSIPNRTKRIDWEMVDCLKEMGVTYNTIAKALGLAKSNLYSNGGASSVRR